MASDVVAQQPDGYIRFEISLNRPYHVQGGPAQDAHDGGSMPLAHAAVVLPELHIQGAVEAVLHPSMTADQVQQGLCLHRSAGEVVAHRALPVPAGAGAPLAAAAVALDGLAAVFRLGREGPPLGVVEGRLHLPVEGTLVALESQHVVGLGLPQRLHDGGLAADGIDGDHGSFQDQAVQQAGERGHLVALGPTRLLGQGQPLPHQEGAYQVQGPCARGPVARAARDLAVQGQDQLPQAGQAKAVQQPEGRLHGRLRDQPPDQAQVGVAGRGGFAQRQPQPEPGPLVVREGGHRGHVVGTPGQRHQECGQKHGQGVAYTARVARIGQRGPMVGEGAQGFQEGGVGACNNVVHEGCSVSFEVVSHPIRRTAALLVALWPVGNRSSTWIIRAVLSAINDR